MVGFKTSDRKKLEKSRILDSRSSDHAKKQVWRFCESLCSFWTFLLPVAVASPNLDQELFCALRGEISNARIPKPVSTGVENVASPY